MFFTGDRIPGTLVKKEARDHQHQKIINSFHTYDFVIIDGLGLIDLISKLIKFDSAHSIKVSIIFGTMNTGEGFTKQKQQVIGNAGLNRI